MRFATPWVLILVDAITAPLGWSQVLRRLPLIGNNSVSAWARTSRCNLGGVLNGEWA